MSTYFKTHSYIPGPCQALKEELHDMDCDVSNGILQAAGIGVVDAAYAPEEV